MDFCLIRGIFEMNSPAIDQKSNEEVGKKTFRLSKGLYLDSFLGLKFVENTQKTAVKI